MSAGSAEAVGAAKLGVSDSVGCDTDNEVLATYLDLEEPRLVLDVRPASAFHQAHLVGSYHISPISELRSRYSYLPPRNVPFLVLADHAKYDESAEAFSSIPSARLIYLVPEELASDSTASGCIASHQRFFDSAQRLGLLRSSQSHQERIASQADGGRDDVPELLFRPSNAVRRTVASLEAQRSQQSSLNVLDMGCGAARDLAWILHGSRTRTSSCSWTGVGVDNWIAALNRAQLLMDDLFLSTSSQRNTHGSQSVPRCDKLLWAKCSDDGFLEPLVGTGKGKAVQTAADEPELWRLYHQLGVAPLLPSALTSNTEEAKFDLVLCVRFHPRALLPRLSQIVRAGGIVLLSHFVTLSEAQRIEASHANPEATIDYDSPPHPGRIQPGEIEDLVQIWNQAERAGHSWNIDADVLEPIEGGRIIRSVALRKVAASM
ncbi:uncharacterized protein SPSC_03288 [Sporisorium scitamineum]|uniref:Rhodanese domain-containing protein n=1 Tax=Sporisorium scitamineum TaxID=49012 RepID=A0A0F7SCE0_9BASI|nr:uncharacterized protein SPSC_03288 [Sporisorium scitamineum]CDW99319.1 hypothetical protein [Sporisorium scitamineum]